MLADKSLSDIDAGVDYLLSTQYGDGHWEDFDLPVGRADAWVTAYVGLALQTVHRYRAHGCALSAAVRAAAWLCRGRSYPAGWGYNGITGPDADSTAYSLHLLRAVGHTVRDEDVQWLIGRWQPSGGFATYDRPDSWGMAHPDVTPAVFRALPPALQRGLLPGVMQYLLRTRDPDGTWPAYWWRTRHYSTFLNHRLARDLGMRIASPCTTVTCEASRRVYSAFDLVFVAANALLDFGLSDSTRALIHILLDLQRSDGSWAGADNLRVTRHDADAPWESPPGRLYTDVNNLITTASAVQMLATYGHGLGS